MSESCKTPPRLAPQSPAASQDPQPESVSGNSAESLQQLENRALGRMMLELRQAAGLTLARICEETGLSPEQIHAIEEGRQPLLLRTFIIVTGPPRHRRHPSPDPTRPVALSGGKWEGRKSRSSLDEAKRNPGCTLPAALYPRLR